ncbi:hypothetical protein GAU_2176 [Gemmatimonas aurantiaca T-27]|uniref:Uncharacterized protein n=1 Tax=Gemmatimonas aurantiaca (strain DSM 14586 / JCM 11422 / NBRC 100505 / T-27) TaxID=379066 RepID=C1A9P1_GEMAT|nr:hypothetical protein GAU_2176 [Gemmatimonas aurantiaca T-27]
MVKASGGSHEKSFSQMLTPLMQISPRLDRRFSRRVASRHVTSQIPGGGEGV